MSEAPTTVGLTLATTTPMTSLGKLLELQGTTNPSSWELSTQRVVGAFFHSADGDCAAASRTCEYECKNAAGGWVIGSSCGGPSKNTFKIVGNELVLSSSSQNALDYEATSQSLDVAVRVVVVDSSGATTVRIGGAPQDLSIPIANVNEAPVGKIQFFFKTLDLQCPHHTPFLFLFLLLLLLLSSSSFVSLLPPFLANDRPFFCTGWNIAGDNSSGRCCWYTFSHRSGLWIAVLNSADIFF